MMNHLPATAYVPFTPVRTVNCILLVMIGVELAQGDVVPREAFRDFQLVASLAIGCLCFLWYRGDSEARGFTRSRLLNVAVVLVPLLAVPWYLLRSRPFVEGGRALITYFGYLLLMPVAACIGVFIHIGIRQAFA
jgi:hypothetical protein